MGRTSLPGTMMASAPDHGFSVPVEVLRTVRLDHYISLSLRGGALILVARVVINGESIRA